jgi:predicted AlkP superfamily pyrophosphatase or phosphodiesterase
LALKNKVLLIILDGQPWRVARRYMGNLEGWVQSGDARVWKMRAVLPSASGPCYVSIHTGVAPQEHGVLTNELLMRVQLPDIFSQVRAAGGKTGAVTHSFWSTYFNRAPFDMVRDIEYDEENGPINHGRFHTMTGTSDDNQMTPSDEDLFATLTMLIQRHDIDYGILHTCTLDCMGHRFAHDSLAMDSACYRMDAMLAHYLPRWRERGFEVIVTSDHGHSDRGHHGGRGEDQQDVALYWFGGGDGPAEDILLGQLQLAPTILARMGTPIPTTMKAKPFLT